MRTRHDLTGMKFNMLTAIKQVNEVGRSHWLCACDCGRKSIVEAVNLRKLKVVSCGCFRDAKAKAESTIHGRAKKTINNIWCGIKQRTRNPNCKVYHYYGGRGIGMFDEWYDSFLKFYEYFGDPPFPRACLDRINNDLGYFPGNVRWVTQKEQCNNKRNTVLITAQGLTKNTEYWAEKTGIKRCTLNSRVRAGWDHERIVSAPLQLKNKPKRKS